MPLLLETLGTLHDYGYQVYLYGPDNMNLCCFTEYRIIPYTGIISTYVFEETRTSNYYRETIEYSQAKEHST